MEELVKRNRSTKRVGIVIHSGTPIFKNGILQNAYFIKVCLEKLGMTCEFLCHEESPAPFGFKDLPLKRISTDPAIFDPTQYHTIMTVTKGVTPKQYTYLKSFKIFVVAFICGNAFMTDMEDFARGPRNANSISCIGKSSPSDELWLIPCYKHSLEYNTIMRGPPSFIVPHLWSPAIVEEMAVTSHKFPIANLHYNPWVHTGKKIDILILEPNIAFFKTSWLPIVAAEKLHLENPDLIESVYVFNFPVNKSSEIMISELTVKDRLKKFDRLSIPEIFEFFNKRNTMPIIVSHQFHNALNYLYYECLHFGWPLVHNSPMLDGCGYFYDDISISGCADAILKAHKHHNKQLREYKETGQKYLERVDPLNEKVCSIWDQLINVGLTKHLTL
jgi:hypothetical protein